MDEVKAIFFDLDNTLYDFKHAWERAHQLLFNELDLNKYFAYSDFMTRYRIEDEKLWEQLTRNQITLDELRAIRPCQTFAYFGQTLSFSEGEKFYQRMFEILLLQIEEDTRINQYLESLSSTYNLYLLTNGLSIEQNKKIDKLKIEKYFKNIYISEEVGFEKPELEFFNYVLKEENLLSENCMMVGDSIVNDILPAQELGMKTSHIQFSELIHSLEKNQMDKLLLKI